MYLTNCVEDLKTQFVGFKKCGIPARHFEHDYTHRPSLERPEGSEIQTSHLLLSETQDTQQVWRFSCLVLLLTRNELSDVQWHHEDSQVFVLCVPLLAHLSLIRSHITIRPSLERLMRRRLSCWCGSASRGHLSLMRSHTTIRP